MKKLTLVILCLIGYWGILSSQMTTNKAPLEVLESALRDISDFFNDNIDPGSSLAFFGITSESSALSEFVINDLITNAVNDKIFTVVDRKVLDDIRSEQAFHVSGEVDDDTSVSLGKLVGASTMILGTINTLGSNYRLSIRAIDVQTAKIKIQANKILGLTREIDILMNGDIVSVPIQTPIPVNEPKISNNTPVAPTKTPVHAKEQKIDGMITLTIVNTTIDTFRQLNIREAGTAIWSKNLLKSRLGKNKETTLEFRLLNSRLYDVRVFGNGNNYIIKRIALTQDTIITFTQNHWSRDGN